MSVESKTKPEAVSKKDSAFVEGISVAVDEVAGNAGPKKTQGLVETAKSSSAPRTPISEGVIAEQNPAENLVEEADDPLGAVPETQPHPEVSPPVTSSSVLPEVKRMEQENKELQAKLAEKNSDIERLKESHEREKAEIERKLNEKERELQSVKEQTNHEIQKLKIEIGLKEWKNENIANLAEKEKEIERLREKEDICQKEINKLKEEKYRLEMKINTTEADLKGQIKILKEQIEHTQGKMTQMEVQVTNKSVKAKVENWDPNTIKFVAVCITVAVLGVAYFNKK